MTCTILYSERRRFDHSTLRFVIRHSKEKHHLVASHIDDDDMPGLVLIEDAEVNRDNQVRPAVTGHRCRGLEWEDSLTLDSFWIFDSL